MVYLLNAIWCTVHTTSIFFWGVVIGHCEEKKVNTNMCLILNVCRDRSVWIWHALFYPHPNYLFIFCRVGWREKFTIPRSHFGCCCSHKEAQSSTQTNNTRPWHTSCKLNWGWPWDLSCKPRIKIKTKLTVSNFSFFVTTYNAFVILDSNSCISVTIQN